MASAPPPLRADSKGAPLEPDDRQPQAWRHRLLLLVLACIPLTSSAADDAELDRLIEMDLGQLMEVQIVAGAGRFPQKVSEAPSRVSIVTAEDIRRHGYRSLAEVLRSIRGLYTSYDRGYEYLGVRGFSRSGDFNTRILILVDGIRLSDPVYSQGPVGNEFPVDLALIEQIEFLPGPGSAAYGNNAFFGVINITTRRPAAIRRNEVVASAGTGDLRGLRATSTVPVSDGAVLLLSASREYRGGDDLRIPAFNQPSNNNGLADDMDRESFNRFFAKLQGDDWRFELMSAKRNKFVPTAPYGQVFNDPRSQFDDQYLLVGATREFTLPDRTEARLQAAYTRYEYTGSYPTDYPPVTLNFDRDIGERITLEGQLRTKRFDGHTVSLWGDASWDPRSSMFNADIAPRAIYLDRKRSDSAAGLFVEDEIRFGEALSVAIGLRWDRLTTGDDSTNPRIGVIYHVDRSTTAKLLYGSAFRAPNTYERFYSVEGFSRANPDLKPERIRTLEAIWEYSSARSRLAASLFGYAVTDLIDNVENGDGTTSFVNLARASVKGLELEAEHAWPGGARLRGSYSFQRGRDDTTGASLTNAPRNMLKLDASTPLGDRVEIGLEARYESGRITHAGARTGGFALLDANLVASRLPGGMHAAIKISNLFDHRYDHPVSIDHAFDRLRQDGRTLRIEGGIDF